MRRSIHKLSKSQHLAEPCIASMDLSDVTNANRSLALLHIELDSRLIAGEVEITLGMLTALSSRLKEAIASLRSVKHEELRCRCDRLVCLYHSSVVPAKSAMEDDLISAEEDLNRRKEELRTTLSMELQAIMDAHASEERQICVDAQAAKASARRQAVHEVIAGVGWAVLPLNRLPPALLAEFTEATGWEISSHMAAAPLKELLKECSSTSSPPERKAATIIATKAATTAASSSKLTSEPPRRTAASTPRAGAAPPSAKDAFEFDEHEAEAIIRRPGSGLNKRKMGSGSWSRGSHVGGSASGSVVKRMQYVAGGAAVSCPW
jgi:hypothetical protein